MTNAELKNYFDKEYKVLANWELDAILLYAEAGRIEFLKRFITKIKTGEDVASGRMKPALRDER
jgi:hypothetical protein